VPKGIPGSTPLCSIPGCGKPNLSRGWCRKHYYTWKRHGDPQGKAPPRTRKPPTPCKVEDCPQPAVCRGWCGIHYQRWRRHGDPLIGRSIQIGNDPICSVEGCNKPHVSSGFCHTHYKRWRKHGDPLLGGLKESPGPCPVEGCGEPARPSGLCPKHYLAQYRDDPEHRRIAREKTAKWRAQNPERQRANLERWRSDPKNQQYARERTRAWRIANPARRTEQTRRRLALKKSGIATRIPLELLAAKLAYWGGRCWIAGPHCTVDRRPGIMSSR
jgi:hypothetical protein